MIPSGHQACTGGRRDGRGLVRVDEPRAGHRTVRDPDRPAHPDPGQLRPRRRSRCRRPSRGTRRSARTPRRSRPAPRRRPRHEGSGAAPAPCSPPRPAGRCPGRARAGADRRPRRPRSPARPAAPGSRSRARSRRSRSSSPYTAGVDSPVRCSATTQCCGCRDSTGTTVSPRPVPSAVPPCSAKATSLPSCAAMRDSSSRVRSSFHSAESPTSAPAASALPPAIPPATGMPLRSTTRTSGIAAGVLGDELDGAPREVPAVRRHLVRAFTVHLDARVLGRRDRHLVEQAHGVEDRGQVVVAVAPQRSDGQMQIDLGRDAHGDRLGNGGQHESSLRARRSGSAHALGRRCAGPGGGAGRSRARPRSRPAAPRRQQERLRHRRRERLVQRRRQLRDPGLDARHRRLRAGRPTAGPASAPRCRRCPAPRRPDGWCCRHPRPRRPGPSAGCASRRCRSGPT